jgi:predicted AAA+ superfamily ATPase
MNFLEREVAMVFAKKVLLNKVLVLLGAKRVGKTAFIKNYLATIPNSTYLQLNGEDIQDPIY